MDTICRIGCAVSYIGWGLTALLAAIGWSLAIWLFSYLFSGKSNKTYQGS